MKRGFFGLAALVLWMLAIQLEAGAAAAGSIEVRLMEKDGGISAGKVTVFFAGSPTAGGYALTEEFGGGEITQMDVLSPELTVWMAGKARGGIQLASDENGSVLFRGLGEGLYLVTGQGNELGEGQFDPFLITIPWDGYIWEIKATPLLHGAQAPDTADPGTLEMGLWGMGLSGLALIMLLTLARRPRYWSFD